MNDSTKDFTIDNELTLMDIVSVLWQKKIKILIFSSIISIFTFFYSLSLPNMYKSEAILASSFKDSDSGLQQFQNLAGISFLQDDSSKMSDKGIEIMKSLNFFEKFASKNNIFFELMAVDGWNAKKKVLLIDSSIYNQKKQKWTSNSSFSKDGKPSMQEAHRKFLKLFQVNYLPGKGFVEISIEHYSPDVAKKWLELIINEINEISRLDEMNSAEKSINYLEKEISETKLIEVRQGLSKLVENQAEKMMFARATPEFLFKILASPYAPEIKSRPSRILYFIISFIISFVTAFFYFLAIYFLNRNQDK